MTNADKNAGERGYEAMGSDQQEKSNLKHGSAAPDKPVSNESRANRSLEEDKKGKQGVKEDKKSSRTLRGPEDWGGYEGY